MFSEKLKALRKSREGLTQEKLADVLGVTQQAVGRWEKDLNMPDNDILVKIADFFHVSIDELLGRPQLKKGLLGNFGDDSQHATAAKIARQILSDEEKKEKGTLIPVLGSIVAGIPITAVEDILNWEEITEQMAHCGKHFALRVKGHSMEPKFIEGDTVIVKETPCVDSGRVAVVLIDNEDATLKKVNITEAGITLIGYNPAVYEPHFYSNQEIKDLPVQIIGEVVELRRKI
jgi:repressor LexA